MLISVCWTVLKYHYPLWWGRGVSKRYLNDITCGMGSKTCQNMISILKYSPLFFLRLLTTMKRRIGITGPSLFVDSMVFRNSSGGRSHSSMMSGLINIYPWPGCDQSRYLAPGTQQRYWQHLPTTVASLRLRLCWAPMVVPQISENMEYRALAGRMMRNIHL